MPGMVARNSGENSGGAVPFDAVSPFNTVRTDPTVAWGMRHTTSAVDCVGVLVMTQGFEQVAMPGYTMAALPD